MADDPRPRGRINQFLGVIQLASSVHATTAEMFSGLRAEADRLGVRLPADIVTAAAQVRSGAVAMAYGSERLAKASFTDALTSDFIGRQPYARGPSGPADVPRWMVDFEIQVTRGSSTSTEWHHLAYTGSLPATVGALYEDIDSYSMLLSQSYTVETGDLGLVRIGSI